MSDDQYRIVVLDDHDRTQTYGPFSDLREARRQAARILTEFPDRVAEAKRALERFDLEVPDFPNIVRVVVEEAVWGTVDILWCE